MRPVPKIPYLISHNQKQAKNKRQLPYIPRIIIKKNGQTNFLDSSKNTWLISPNNIRPQMKKCLKKCEQLHKIEDKSTKSETDQVSTNLYYYLKVIVELNKLILDPYVQLYSIINLVHICYTLRLDQLRDVFTKKLILLLMKELNNNQFRVPKHYFMKLKTNILSTRRKLPPDCKKQFEQICYKRSISHLKLSRIDFIIMVDQFNHSKIKEAKLKIQNGYKNLLKSMIQMLFVVLSSYIQKNKSAQKQIYEGEQHQKIIEQQTIRFLYKTAYKDAITTDNSELLVLNKLIRMQVEENYGMLKPFLNKQITNTNLIKIKIQSFEQALKFNFNTLAQLAVIQYTESSNSKIQQFIPLWVCFTYLHYLILNVESATKQKQQVQNSQQYQQNNKKKVTIQQTWLAKSLQISHQYWHKSLLYDKIKNQYIQKYSKYIQNQWDNNKPDESNLIQNDSDSLFQILEKVGDNQKKIDDFKDKIRMYQKQNRFQIIELKSTGGKPSFWIRKLKLSVHYKSQSQKYSQDYLSSINETDMPLRVNKFRRNHRLLSRQKGYRSQQKSVKKSKDSRTIQQIRSTYNLSARNRSGNLSAEKNLKISGYSFHSQKKGENFNQPVKYQFNKISSFIQQVALKNPIAIDQIRDVKSFQNVNFETLDNVKAIMTGKNYREQQRMKSLKQRYNKQPL